MVRCFEDENVHHVNGKIDSITDIDTINFELALADISQIEKRIQRLEKTKFKSKEEATTSEVRRAALDLGSCIHKGSLESQLFHVLSDI